MDKLRVQEPAHLQNEVTISGARNTALPIFFSMLPAEEPVEVQNVPKLKSIDTTMKLLSRLGAKIERNGSVWIDASPVDVFCAPYDLVRTIRASIQAPGPLAAHFGQGQVSLPGGCAIGAHPVDLCTSGLEQLDAEIKLEEGYAKASVNGRLKGVHIAMDRVSVGTIAAIMSAVTLTEGTTIIESATREPEIVDIISFSNALGAKTEGQDTGRIIIEDVRRLGDGIYHVLSDHIETDTFLVAAAISGGKILYHNAQPDTLDAILVGLHDAGVDIKTDEGWISLDMYSNRPKTVNVCTTSHPGSPTGMQAQFTLLNPATEGTGVITEMIFENRFMHIPELIRMGAYVEIENNTVICYGVRQLPGTRVMATDLCVSASPVLAGYIAEGTTTVDRIYHIDHGYERIEDKLQASGANIQRVKGE